MNTSLVTKPQGAEPSPELLYIIEKAGGLLTYVNCISALIENEVIIIFRAESVAEGIMKLISDTSLNGEILKLTIRKGLRFEKYESFQEYLEKE